jgi:hypothetical protein
MGSTLTGRGRCTRWWTRCISRRTCVGRGRRSRRTVAAAGSTGRASRSLTKGLTSTWDGFTRSCVPTATSPCQASGWRFPRLASRGRRVRWASRRSRHTGASSRISSDSVIVVHPFHPLAGQRLLVLFERHLATGLVYICEGGSLGTVTLPEDFTDRGLPPATRPLTTEVLAGLGAILSALKRKP